jgi:sulfatase modifying factor 1
VFGEGANSFSIEFVTIGNPGNDDDTGDGISSVGGVQRFGGVDYVYRIGTYEISERMIDAANALGSLGFTHDNRGPEMPATSLRWHQMARFVNWSNISEGYAPAYKFGGPLPGEPGYNPIGVSATWGPGDPGYDADNPYRSTLAKYVLPSIDEWYKAAYYDAAAGAYYNYPFGSDDVPDGKDSPTDPTFDAVFVDGGSFHSPHDVTNAGAASPYGTVGQGGNVDEWLESIHDPTGLGTNPAIRGGHYNRGSFDLQSREQSHQLRSSARNTLGFRVASLAQTDYLFTVKYLTATGSGPLIAGFDPLPETVTAKFRLNNQLPRQTVVGLDQVLTFEIELPGSGPITRDDLTDFQLTRGADGTPTALNWNANGDKLAPGLILGNNSFTLTVTGVDSATEEEFTYNWSESINELAPAAVSSSCDFNGDGQVDRDDLALWRANFGDAGAANFADGDGDGDVDGNDFLCWQRELGVNSATAASGAVPEPGAGLLGVLACLSGVPRWRGANDRARATQLHQAAGAV